MKRILLSVAGVLAMAGLAEAQFGVTIRTRNGAGAATDRIRVETAVANANVRFDNAFMEFNSIGAPPVSAPGFGRIFFNGTQFLLSENGGGYVPLVGGGGGVTAVEAQAGPGIDMAAAGAGLSVAGAGNVVTYTLTDLWVNAAGDAMAGTLALGGAPALTIGGQNVAATDGSAPNAGSNLIHWDNLLGVPAGFADGTDDGGTNADTLDLLDSLQFLRSDTADNYTAGTMTFNAGTTVNILGTFQIGTQTVGLSDGTAPNAGSNLLHWDNLTGVPAGFADGTDDGAGGGAPVGALYVTLLADAALTAERILSAGIGISVVDGGANSPVTVATNLAVNDGTINEVTDLVHWNELQGVPGPIADGTDADTTYTAGAGLTLGGTVFSTNLAANDGIANEAGDLVNWNEITNMPAGFADGTDDGAGGGITSVEAQVGPAVDMAAAGAGLSVAGAGNIVTYTLADLWVNTTGDAMTGTLALGGAPALTIGGQNVAATDGSAPNAGSNLIHWDNLVGVPLGFADGSDDGAGGGITSLNAQVGAVQTFANDTNVTIASAANIHTLGWAGQLSAARGGTGIDTSLAAAGSILRRNAGAWEVLAPGAGGDVLTIAGGLPTWAPGGGGGITSVEGQAGPAIDMAVGPTGALTVAGALNTVTYDISTAYFNANYIQNQTAAAQTAGFWTTGPFGRVGTLAPVMYGQLLNGTLDGVLGENNTAPAGSLTRAGVTGTTNQGNDLAFSVDTGVFGIATAANGCAVMGAGQGAIEVFDTNGFGGGFTGTSQGVFGFTTNVATDQFSVVGIYGEAAALDSFAIVGCMFGGTNYKILGGLFATVSTVAPTSEGERIFYAPEMPEPYFMDAGTGTLTGGSVTIKLDPIFKDVIATDAAHPMIITVTPTGGAKGALQVTKKDGEFVVTDLGGASSATFDYVVMGKWKPYKDLRTPEFKRPWNFKQRGSATSGRTN